MAADDDVVVEQRDRDIAWTAHSAPYDDEDAWIIARYRQSIEREARRKALLEAAEVVQAGEGKAADLLRRKAEAEESK